MEAVLLKKWEVLATRYDELTNQLMDPSHDEPALAATQSK